MTLIQYRTRAKPRVAVTPEATVFGVWGAIGSPGKTSVSLNLAYEFSALGKRVLVVDLDTYGPTLSNLLPIGQPTAGLAGVARLIRQGRFTFEELERLSTQVVHKKNKFHLLSGLGSSSRWPEVTQETVHQLIAISRFNFDIVILDLASPIEGNLFAPEHVTMRNVAARTSISLADFLLVILGGSQNLLARYLSQTSELDELQKNRLLVLNRAATNPALARALKELTGESILATIPNDEPSFQLAESQQLPLAIARRKSAARTSIAELAHKLLAWQPSVK